MSEPKDKFDEHENTDLINILEQLGSIIESKYSEAMIVIKTDQSPIIWSKGEAYDILKLCAPIIRRLKSQVINDIDC